MARIAFIMDRIFRKFGLSGKSFIPMLDRKQVVVFRVLWPHELSRMTATGR